MCPVSFCCSHFQTVKLARYAAHVGGEIVSPEQKIQIAVARADLFLTRYGLLIATVFIILFVVILCLILNERK